MGVFTMENFLCWTLKGASVAVCIYVIATATVASLLEILDIAAENDPNFEISGGFQSIWRAHVWEGWLACNLVMMFCHFIMIGFSAVMILAVKKFPTYYEYNLWRLYMISFIVYILVELGTQLYRYSWYGPNIFRLGYLVFTFMYWIIRTLFNIASVFIVHSRIIELQYEITYGEKRNLAGWTADGLMSGTTTPAMSTVRTPLTYI